jgi:PadR family transcriptional regulator, regulatory protein PadR
MSKKQRKMSMQTFRVLQALAQRPGVPMCGADFIKDLNISSGTVYPILLRLEADGLVKSKWETEDSSELGRPRRRLYEITGDGISALQKMLGELSQYSGQN